MLISEWLAWALTPLPLLLPLAVAVAWFVAGRRIQRQQTAEELAESERFDEQLRALIEQERKQ